VGTEDDERDGVPGDARVGGDGPDLRAQHPGLQGGGDDGEDLPFGAGDQQAQTDGGGVEHAAQLGQSGEAAVGAGAQQCRGGDPWCADPYLERFDAAGAEVAEPVVSGAVVPVAEDEHLLAGGVVDGWGCLGPARQAGGRWCGGGVCCGRCHEFIVMTCRFIA